MTSVTTVGTGVTLTLDTLDGEEVVRENLAINGNMVSAGAPFAQATNLVVNPSFENGYSSWTLANCTATVTNSFSQMLKAGGNILQAVSDGTHTQPSVSVISASYRAEVVPGQWVGLTAFMATEAGYEVRVWINWRNAAGSTLSNSLSPWMVGSFYAGANPQIVAQAPADAASAGYYLQWRNPADTVNPMISGKRMWADAVKLVVRATQEEAQYWTDFPYWDGSTSPVDFTTSWDGTAHLSSSKVYSNTPTGVTGSAGTGGVVYLNNATAGGPKEGTHYARCTWVKGSASGSAGLIYTQTAGGSAGDVSSCRVSLRTSSTAKDIALLFRFRNVNTTVNQSPLTYVRLTPGQWTEFSFDGLVAAGTYTNIQVYALISNSNTQLQNETLDMDCVLIEKQPTAAPQYYDGNSTNSAEVDYIWTGAPNASTSKAIYHVTSPGYPVGTLGYSDLPPRVRVTVSGFVGTKTFSLARSCGGDTHTVPGWVARTFGDSDIDTDWWAPLNRPITYTLSDSTGVLATATIQLDSNAAILQDPVLPDKFIRVTAKGQRIPNWATMREGSTGQVRYGQGPTVVPILGSKYGVALGGQSNRGQGIPELLSTYTEDMANRFRDMVLQGSVVWLLRTTQDMKALPPLAYLAGAFAETPVNAMYEEPGKAVTHWDVTGDLVQAVMQVAKSGYVTYDQVQALLAGLTYNQVQTKYTGLQYLAVQQNPRLYETL